MVIYSSFGPFRRVVHVVLEFLRQVQIQEDGMEGAVGVRWCNGDWAAGQSEISVAYFLFEGS